MLPVFVTIYQSMSELAVKRSVLTKSTVVDPLELSNANSELIFCL